MKKIDTALLRRRLGLGAAVVVLVGVLGFLVTQTRSVDFDSHNEIIGVLRQLKQVDAEWNVDVLRSKTGINTNYDPVASPLPLIASLETTLAERTTSAWADGAGRERLRPLLDEYRTTMDRKIGLIERFKSQNAILRNSSRYLPLAGEDALKMVKASALEPRRLAEFESAIDELLIGAMNFLLTSDPALKSEVNEHLAWLEERAPALPAELRDQIAVATAHAATVLRQNEAGEKILAELARLPTAQQIDRLSDAYNQEHDRLLLDRQSWARVLLGYSALLLVLVAWQGWRLFRSYRLLNDANSRLSRANRELQESQSALVQSEKMSALGQMVAGIAHEINTPLAYVKGTIQVLRDHMQRVNTLATRSFVFTEMLGRKERDNDALARQFAEVRQLAQEAVEHGMIDELAKLLEDGAGGIDQISEIVVNLKNFSRLDRARISSFDVREGLDSTLLLARNMLKSKVRIVKEFSAVPKIGCSPSQINQVFLNIITNAVQAMPEGRDGELTLRTEREDDKTVRIEIQDNGSGIPQDVLPKIFDPFFTTKEIGKGTGMGLAISYKIVQQHGGAILVDTEQDVGTVFTILLPIEPPAEPSAAVIAGEEMAAA